MRRGILAVVLLAGAASVAQAQSAIPATEASVPSNLGLPHDTNAPSDGVRWWARGEYLLMWISNDSLPRILVVGGGPPPGGAVPGAADLPQLFFPSRSIDFGSYSAGRISVGGWLDCCRTCGVEANGIFFGRSASQTSTTITQLHTVLPVPQPPPPPPIGGGEEVTGALFLPNQLPGLRAPLDVLQINTLSVRSTSRPWGMDFNGVMNLGRSGGLEINLLAGFRYFDLLENLDAVETERFDPDIINAGTAGYGIHLGARNQFYGGQIGGRVHCESSKLSADLTALVALGSTHQVLNATESQSALGSSASQSFRFRGDDFAVLPVVQLRAGYAVTNCLRATVGYEMLYWSSVIRPGRELEGLLNTEDPSSFNLRRTDLFVHGVSFGLEMRW